MSADAKVLLMVVGFVATVFVSTWIYAWVTGQRYFGSKN